MKISNFKFQILNSQAGVTLLLSILLLASILAISFSLTTILFIEVRSSADLLKTEGALYGATGVGEQAFFNLERNVVSPSYITSQFNNNVVLKGQPVVSIASNPIFISKVGPGSSFTTTTNKYDFCTAAAVTNGCSFGKVTVNYINTNTGSNPLYAYLCQWDPNGTYPSAPCVTTGQSQGYWIGPSDPSGATFDTQGFVQLTPVNNSVSWTLDKDLQQELILTNPYPSGSIYFSISTFGADGTTPKGLPFVGKTSVIINTQNGSMNRKIQVTVPIR